MYCLPPFKALNPPPPSANCSIAYIHYCSFVCYQEPSKRTSIYYTGPRRTRPSPRAGGMGRASVMGAKQFIADPTISSQKSSAYDPLATMVGKQGNQELGT